MHGDFSTIQPWLIAALLVWAIYRRIKRSFGRQPLRPRRMLVRVGLLIVIACLLVPTALRSSVVLGATAAGLAAGIALGFWGAAHTRFLDSDGKRYYVPHTYTGIAVTLLVVGRVAYRATQMFGAAHTSLPVGAGTSAGVYHPAGGLVQSPLTIAVLFVLVGYYVCFYVRVLQKSKHPAAADIEPTPQEAASQVSPPAQMPPG